MKFGHDLPRNQVPEWASSYINYRGLKKLIKTAAEAARDGSAPDLAGRFYSLLETFRYTARSTLDNRSSCWFLAMDESS